MRRSLLAKVLQRVAEQQQDPVLPAEALPNCSLWSAVGEDQGAGAISQRQARTPHCAHRAVAGLASS